MSQQYQKQKEKWFNAGKSQATKEILEEVNNSGFEMKNEIGNDHYFIIPSDNWKILKQKLQNIHSPKEQNTEKKSVVIAPEDTNICANCGQRKDQHSRTINYAKEGIMYKCRQFVPKQLQKLGEKK